MPSPPPDPTPSPSVAVLVVAAGRGSRAGEGTPKQYREIAGIPLIRLVLGRLIEALPDAPIVTVIHPDDHALLDAGCGPLRTRVGAPVHGGATRQQSVLAGLEALASASQVPEIVLIHDCARPFVSVDVVHSAVWAAKETGAAVPGVAVTDTIKEVEADGRIVGTPRRDRLRAVQTPQAFRFPLILDAHRRAAAAGVSDLTDDAAVAEWAGLPVHVFAGNAQNMKITTPDDFARAEQALLGSLPDVRTGQGFDVHALGDGDHVWLGGVKISHSHGLIGHSDADVLMHAVTDAIFGALADGDIGSHFPPSDPQWKGAASDIFLRYAVERVRSRGGMIAHVDGTVICEHPKVGPHRDAIRARLAEIIGIGIDRVAVKATTSERLGFTGRGEGIAAMATATVRLP
jgi:2-C-methyl-D-erythritol 4-phosphate cytidylyltransferase/2-C-methyl-D-erythritol 2,4-cyclodiphosphate synthase